MPEGTTSRVMAANRPNVEFYDFYSVSPECFGYTLVRSYITYSLTHCATVTTNEGFIKEPLQRKAL
jgi:hypothetical protein